MQKRFNGKVTVIILAALFSMIFVGALAATVTSPSAKFNVTHSFVVLNHTNSFFDNITIGAGSAGTTTLMEINNVTTTISANYSQPTSTVLCGANGAFAPQVRNATGVFNSTVVASNLNQSIAIFLDTLQMACSPGKYFGYINVTNSTNTTDTVAISLLIDIPITNSTSAFNSSSTGQHVGVYNGTLPAFANASHSYFFDISAIKNTTGFVVNLTAANDIDIFLIDNVSVLRDKSIDDTTTKRIVSSFNPVNGTWEIRIYGNKSSSTAYSGLLIFSTLNITNATSGPTLLQMKLVNYGTLRAGDSTYTPVTLDNIGERDFNGTKQNAEIASVNILGTSNVSRNFNLLVPNSTTKIRVAVNWTTSGATNTSTNYTLTLTSPNGTVINVSVNNHLNANFFNVSSIAREEFIETTQIAEGGWNVSVSNGSSTLVGLGNTNNDYMVVAKLFFNPSGRIITNFTSASENISRVGVANSSLKLDWNISVLNDTLPGTYEGYIEYVASHGATTRSNFRYSVDTASVVVNNTFNSSTVTLDQNSGQGIRTFVNVTFNNTGTLATSLSTTNSSLALVLPSNTSSMINFTYDIGPGTLAAKDNRTINITFSGNTSISTGMHVGWIFINSTDSHPAHGFNLTLRINVTNTLRVSIVDILSNTTETDHVMNNTEVNENVTVRAQVRYANGTLINVVDGLRFTQSNISVFMIHQNVTSKRYATNTSLQFFSNLTSPIFDESSNEIRINFTLFNQTLGGPYDVRFVAVLNITGGNGSTYVGEGVYNNFTVRNASFLMSTNASSCSFGAASCDGSLTLAGTTNISVNISNFGPLPSSSVGTVTINLTAPACPGYRTATLVSTCSGASASSGQWTVTPGVAEKCYVSWNVIPRDTDASACTASVVATPTNRWFSSSGINISFTVDVAGSSSSSSDSSSSGSSSSSETTTTSSSSATSPKYLQISQWDSVVEVGQGETGTATATVENTNDTISQTVTLDVTGLNSNITYSVLTEPIIIEPGETQEFEVSFTVSNDTKVDEYPGAFEASSSKDTATADFSVHVLPNEESKAKISSDFDALKAEFAALWGEVNSTKSFGGNVSATESLIAQVNAKLAEAEAALALGTDQGYFTAAQLIEEAKNLLNTAKAQLTVDKQAAGFTLPISPLYIGIAVGVAAVGFLVYLFLPGKVGVLKKLTGSGAGSAASSAGSKVASAAGNVKDVSKEQFDKLKEKFKLKREYKYKYEE